MRRRYDRKAIVRALGTTSPEYAQVIAVFANDAPPNFREVPRLWFERVVASCLDGRLPELDAFPRLVLTSETDSSDPRWRFYSFLTSQFGTLPILQHPGVNGDIGALQFISTGEAAYLATNRAVQGRFWVWIDGRPHMEVGVEVANRTNWSHITALLGTVRGAPGALVFWQLMPSVVRRRPASQLTRDLDQGINVPGARQRWGGLRNAIDPEEIRSALFEAEKLGVHPDAIGSTMVDLLERTHGAGLPSRRSAIDVSPLSDSAEGVADKAPLFVDRVEINDALERMRAALTPDERALLDALRHNLTPSPAEIARINGWSAADVSATLKRIKRKARKLLNS